MENLGKVVAILVLIALIIVAFLVVAGWMLMLAIGVVHSIFGWPITVAFFDGIKLAWAVAVIGSIFNHGIFSSKVNSKS